MSVCLCVKCECADTEEKQDNDAGERRILLRRKWRRRIDVQAHTFIVYIQIHKNLWVSDMISQVHRKFLEKLSSSACKSINVEAGALTYTGN